jgi:hypothetical protein
MEEICSTAAGQEMRGGSCDGEMISRVGGGEYEPEYQRAEEKEVDGGREHGWDPLSSPHS